MRKILIFLVIIGNFHFSFGQKNSKLFRIEGDTLITEQFELISDNEKRIVKGLRIKTPNKIKNIKFIISSAIFDIKSIKGSHLLIVGDILSIENLKFKTINTNNLVKNILNLKLGNVIEIDNNKLFLKQTYPKKGIRIKKKRYHGLIVNEGFLVFYINFRKKELMKVENILKSFEVKSNI